MLFNSYIFLFALLPLILVGYYVLPKAWRAGWLVLCSYVFYGWWDWRYCLLLLLVTIVDYSLGKAISKTENSRKRKVLVTASVVCDLALLGFFKYYDLLARTANGLWSWLQGSTGGIPVLDLVLPVGISFYIFQSMSYTIDIYRREARPARSFIDFACYVSLFPQLVAGPIVRYRDLDEQLRLREHSWNKAGAGFALFTLGLAKKVLVADAVAPMADWAFGQAAPGLLASWTGLLAYTFQIYFDFSGYSDMAVGLGLLLGFEFPINFNSPYKSCSMTEFWRRWHISLSSWLRDYLYIPLGGNRKGDARTYFNLFVTMLLGGLWHGPSWTFLVWGGYHGLWLALERMRGKHGLWGERGPKGLRMAATFLATMIGWLFFKAEDLDAVARMFKGLFGCAGWGQAYAWEGGGLATWLMLVVAAFLVWGCKNTWEMRWAPSICRWLGIVALLVVCIGVLLANASSPFLYFQF